VGGRGGSGDVPLRSFDQPAEPLKLCARRGWGGPHCGARFGDPNSPLDWSGHTHVARDEQTQRMIATSGD